MSRLHAGQTLTVANQAVGDDGTWKTAENAVSSVGGRLVTNGVANSNFEAGAAPRTAVGIKADGNIIFYTLDGRQSGYSYGAQLKTLAKRMVELGCVDALNLDGGGSTTISAWFPGKDNTMVVNSPSDGYLRSVANYIFLKDNRERTNIPWIINITGGTNNNYLSGMTANINIESVYDTANYKMEEPYNIKYRAETDTDSTVDENGAVSLNGTGDVKVVMYGDNGDVADVTYGVYETPEEIKVYNQADWKEISEIYTEANEELQLNLSAASYKNGTELLSTNRLYKWEVEGDIGTITEDGIFTLADTVNKDGKIKVTAGDLTKEIPVHISDYPSTPNPFYDTENHWAKDIIADMAATGIISGFEEDGKMIFKPDNNMTRAEFASMIANYKKLDFSKYDDVKLDFTDNDIIPQWAVSAVKAVYKEGIILGRVNDDGTSTFAPYDNITRAEAMTILGRILPNNDDLPNLPFADKNDIPFYDLKTGERIINEWVVDNEGVVWGYKGNETDIVIPREVNGIAINKIGENAFANSKITSVEMEDNIQSVDDDAFIDCESLRSVKLSKSMESIPGCFSGCGSLEYISIPSNIKSIYLYAFYSCKNVVIHCAEGSTAQEYAINNNISYVIDENL